MRNNLPKKINENECGIVNLGDKDSDGSHWTSYVKRKNDIQYFDSYGNLKPPLELVLYFLTDCKCNNITYNYDQLQKFNSKNCGHLCLYFLYNNCK